eukprot:6213850-Pleurochrysis_carterae.AAC.3
MTCAPSRRQSAPSAFDARSLGTGPREVPRLAAPPLPRAACACRRDGECAQSLEATDPAPSPIHASSAVFFVAGVVTASNAAQGNAGARAPSCRRAFVLNGESRCDTRGEDAWPALRPHVVSVPNRSTARSRSVSAFDAEVSFSDGTARTTAGAEAFVLPTTVAVDAPAVASTTCGRSGTSARVPTPETVSGRSTFLLPAAENACDRAPSRVLKTARTATPRLP